MVFRVYVEKKPGFDVEAQQLGTELKTILGINGLRKVRIVNRYDVEGSSSNRPRLPCSASRRWMTPPRTCLTSAMRRCSPPSSCPDSSTSAPTPPQSASS